MPHRCTKCSKEYQDGDMRILQGCECGNNSFLYVPKEKKEGKAEEIKTQLSEMGIESIKIIAPGQYEINLDKIFSRDEIIIALQQNGRYVIHLPSLLKKKKK
jgi:hypothetical protein